VLERGNEIHPVLTGFRPHVGGAVNAQLSRRFWVRDRHRIRFEELPDAQRSGRGWNASEIRFGSVRGEAERAGTVADLTPVQGRVHRSLG
jgi:hypothetical protein